ncbi:MAG TPA: carbon monoxide dehydrogenase subunit G [Blastocatellia bacterium]|nr:carbon monoxide dehydrogenase subunit G [Blastocatellia bacterium]
MKIEGSYTIKGHRLRVWQLMTSPETLQRCIPGCELLEANDDGSYRMTLKAGVGSIKGVYHGTTRLDEIREPDHYRMVVEAKGSAGFVKGEGALDLAEQGEETLVTYQGEVNVGGTIASVGQRMIGSTAKMMAGQFFAAIEAEAKAWAKAEENGEPFQAPKQGFIRNTIRQIKK